jgi:hypothetical protein
MVGLISIGGGNDLEFAGMRRGIEGLRTPGFDLISRLKDSLDRFVTICFVFLAAVLLVFSFRLLLGIVFVGKGGAFGVDGFCFVLVVRPVFGFMVECFVFVIELEEYVR